MKRMILLLTMAGLLSVMFCACDPGTMRFDYTDLARNVVRIELIDYDNPDQKSFFSWVPDHSEEMPSFDPERMEILEDLPETLIRKLLRKLSYMEILRDYGVFDSPKGLCLKLTYRNEDFLILNCNREKETFMGYVGLYSSDGELLEFIGCFSSLYDFEALINDYFETKLQ